MFSFMFSPRKYSKRKNSKHSKRKNSKYNNDLSKGSTSPKKTTKDKKPTKDKKKRKRLTIPKGINKLPIIISQSKYRPPLLTLKRKKKCTQTPLKKRFYVSKPSSCGRKCTRNLKSRGFTMSNSSMMSNINGRKNVRRNLSRQSMMDGVSGPLIQASQNNNVVQLPDGSLVQLPNQELASQLISRLQ